MAGKDKEQQKGFWQRLKENASDMNLHGFGSLVGGASLVQALYKARYGVTIDQPIGEGVRDTVRDAAALTTWLVADGAGGRLGWGSPSGDQQAYTKVADSVEEFWDKYIKRAQGHGEFEFRMAVGWEMPEGVLYNGKKVDPGKTIENMSAVFFKNAKGKVEVIDYHDSRYAGVVGPYVATQFATIFGGGGAAALSKAPKGVKVAAGVASTVDATSSVGYIGGVFQHSLSLRPEAIRHMSGLIDKLASANKDKVRDDINVVLQDYSYPYGPDVQQYYIPSLRDHENPMKRLQDLSQGVVEGGFMLRTPFDRITNTSTKSDRYLDVISVADVRQDMREIPEFMRSYYRLAQKAVSQNDLSQGETLALRFGMNVVKNYDFPLVGNDVSKNGKKQFSKEEREETIEFLKKTLSRDLVAAMPRKSPADADAAFDKPLPDIQLKGYLAKQVHAIDHQLSTAKAQREQTLYEGMMLAP